jgi:hypothetical protein
MKSKLNTNVEMISTIAGAGSFCPCAIPKEILSV